MAEYKVVFEIQVDADDPKDAAQTVQDWIKETGAFFQFYVQKEYDKDNKDIYSVDLNEGETKIVTDYTPMIDNK